MKRLTFIALVVFVSAFGSHNVVETGEFSNEIVMSDPVNISNSSSMLLQYECISVDGEGFISVVWWEGLPSWEIYLSRSLDGGNTFTEPVLVMPYIYGYKYSQLSLANTSGGIHITWTLFDQIYGGAEIIYIRSIDGGETFSNPLIVSNVDSVISYIPSVATDGSNRIGIVWADFGVGIYYSGSVDNGETFSTPMILASDAPNLGGPDIAIYSENIYVVWTQGEDPQEEVFFSRSADGGITFSTPINISNFPEKSWTPKISVDTSGNIYIVWEEGPAFSTRLLFVRSNDGGDSFSSPLTLAVPGDFVTCPSITSIDDGTVYITGSVTDDYYETWQNYLVWSTDKGAAFSNPHSIPFDSEEIGCPQIAAMEHNQIGLVWHVSNDIFFSRGEVPIPSSKAMPWILLLLGD